MRTSRSLLTAMFAVILSDGVALAQRTGGGSTGGSTGGGRTSSPVPTTRPNVSSPNDQRPRLFSGRVMLDSGDSPGEPVAIVTICSSRRTIEAYTDSKGRFGFEMGRNNALGLADASSEPRTVGLPGGGSPSPFSNFGGGLSGSSGSLLGCEMKAELPGFQSDTIQLSNRQYLDNPDTGTIVLRRLSRNAKGTTLSVNSALAPPPAQKAFRKGLELRRQEKTADARKQFEKAVELYPAYATALFHLGLIKGMEKDNDGANDCFERAMKADPKFVLPMLPAADLAIQAKNWQRAAELVKRGVALDPSSFPRLYAFGFVAHYNLGDLATATKMLEQGVRVDSEHRVPEMNRILGYLQMDAGNYKIAGEHLRNYLKYAPNATDATQVRENLNKLTLALGEPAPAMPATPSTNEKNGGKKQN